ncbi:hypothetical protein L5515_017656 [Caenorhabditis briggsae]|uniref:Uncharacterized protein n=1 Tax=Caenorhabditis briggsae TaxID=6238 RepID=A0AAE9FHG0_CAEBR|nr:hypothetical protein L5515_017656 [Caenorhabditis briggsae]
MNKRFLIILLCVLSVSSAHLIKIGKPEEKNAIDNILQPPGLIIISKFLGESFWSCTLPLASIHTFRKGSKIKLSTMPEFNKLVLALSVLLVIFSLIDVCCGAPPDRLDYDANPPAFNELLNLRPPNDLNSWKRTTTPFAMPTSGTERTVMHYVVLIGSGSIILLGIVILYFIRQAMAFHYQKARRQSRQVSLGVRSGKESMENEEEESEDMVEE